MNQQIDPVLSGVIDTVRVYMIPGWEGYYAISRDGRVWSENRAVRTINDHVTRVNGKWLKERRVHYSFGWGRKGYVFHRDGHESEHETSDLLRATFGDTAPDSTPPETP